MIQDSKVFLFTKSSILYVINREEQEQCSPLINVIKNHQTFVTSPYDVLQTKLDVAELPNKIKGLESLMQ